jgi:pyrimidine deaminase RibD-like protein
MHEELHKLMQKTDAQHICVILRNDRFIVSGYSRRMGERYSHAEQNAIKELSEHRKRYWDMYNKTQHGGLTLVVIRYKNNQLRESKPCSHCCAAIRATGLFKDICYSTSEGVMAKQRVHELESDYISTGDAYLRSIGGRSELSRVKLSKASSKPAESCGNHSLAKTRPRKVVL